MRNPWGNGLCHHSVGIRVSLGLTVGRRPSLPIQECHSPAFQSPSRRHPLSRPHTPRPCLAPSFWPSGQNHSRPSLLCGHAFQRRPPSHQCHVGGGRERAGRGGRCALNMGCPRWPGQHLSLPGTPQQSTRCWRHASWHASTQAQTASGHFGTLSPAGPGDCSLVRKDRPHLQRGPSGQLASR